MNKYIFARQLIYETIRKSVELKVSPKIIAQDMFEQYRLEVSLHDLPKPMILTMYQILAEQCWYDIHKEHYIGD